MKKLAKQFREELENSNLIPVFEVEVIDKRTSESDYITFDVSIEDTCIIAQHVALNEEQEKSNKIAFVSFDLDECFSLDEHLETLHELCLNELIDSEFYRLK